MSLSIIAAGKHKSLCSLPDNTKFFCRLVVNIVAVCLVQKAGIDMQGLGAPEIPQNCHSHPSCLEVYESDLCLLLSPLNLWTFLRLVTYIDNLSDLVLCLICKRSNASSEIVDRSRGKIFPIRLTPGEKSYRYLCWWRWQVSGIVEVCKLA
ncbi:hypothetical protein H5410_025431 [Solanum commersonii]|uniref:Uncharacterized protein n=1 Tax=Solanum commersonii TaxID=4109 RepID=A0A9J5YT36_SOLCO|nr:hypothetical protein H5410_025431 [Solanum commersonii]